MGLLRLDNLSLRYGGRDVAAVEALTLDVNEGEFLALVGPSGCGKTTTLRLIAGFLAPDEGDISVAGQVLSSPGHVVPPERRGMGMVFQSYAVWPHMTVFQNVAFGLAARKVKRDEVKRRVLDMLDTVNLAGLDGEYPARLSGGQQQRVALARSLVVEPRILLLDEPLSNLDARLRERMRWELKDLQRRTGVTFVYVTHDQTEAMVMADRVAIMRDGRLQQLGPPAEVYRRPANAFVADFMGSVNLIPATIVSLIGGTARVRLLDQPPLELDVACSSATLAEGAAVLLAIRPEDVSLDSATGFTARVEQATFLGNLNEYRLTLDGTGPAAPLSLRVQTAPRQTFAAGASVGVRLDPERCVLLPSLSASRPAV